MSVALCRHVGGPPQPDAFVEKNGDRDLIADQEVGSEDQTILGERHEDVSAFGL